MAMKLILAPIIGSPADKTALEAAHVLAAMNGGHIEALFIHRDPRQAMMGQVGEGMTAGALETLMDAAQGELRDSRSHAKQHYDEWLAAAGIKDTSTPQTGSEVTASWTEAVGNPEDVVGRQGRLYDVISVVQPGEDDHDDLPLILDGALLESGRAVLMTSPWAPLQSIKRVAIGWNKSIEASRAAALAGPLIELVGAAVVLCGTGGSLEEADIEEFVRALQWRGIETSSASFDIDAGAVTDHLQEGAVAAGAQILVLGAYSHSRLRQMVFGGVTSNILKVSKLPILMTN